MIKKYEKLARIVGTIQDQRTSRHSCRRSFTLDNPRWGCRSSSAKPIPVCSLPKLPDEKGSLTHAEGEALVGLDCWANSRSAEECRC